MKRQCMKGLAAAAALLFAQWTFAQGGQAETGTPSKPPAAKRTELRKMCDDALATLYKAKPELKAHVAKSAGYGCFSSFGISFLVGGAGGQGLVHANATKKDVYMNMGQASGGVDFGIKKYREVLVFKDTKTLNQFVDKGWEVSGGGSATAAVGGKGGTADTTETQSGAVEVYPMTDTGLAIGASAAARKYWKDEALNAAK
jgi:lipid-binding SYLF domain-containing protein